MLPPESCLQKVLPKLFEMFSVSVHLFSICTFAKKSLLLRGLFSFAQLLFPVHSPSHLYSHFGGAVWLLPRQLQPRTYYYQPQAQLECSVVGVVYGRDWTYLHRKKKKCFDEQDFSTKKSKKKEGLDQLVNLYFVDSVSNFVGKARKANHEAYRDITRYIAESVGITQTVTIVGFFAEK